MIDLAVGGVVIRLVARGAGAAVLEAALVERWAGFRAEAADPDVTLAVQAPAGFSVDYHLERNEAALAIVPCAERDLVRFEGAARGWFDAERANGALEPAAHLGQVDALIRLALSLMLPRRRALLVHGTAITTERNAGVTVLVGASGAGKSTAAAALGGELGDELVVLHATPEGGCASGTPYWRGRPGRHPVRLIAVLRRGGAGARCALAGSEALRAIAAHTVRYVPNAAVDHAAFALLAQLCTQLPVLRLDCPEGAAFVPFLRRALVEARGGAQAARP